MRAGERTRVAVYRRRVGASLERVWENVLDWEHLPWLHAGSFRSIHCRHAGDWGWRAQVRLEPRGDHAELELLIEREAGRYVARTLEGRGRGTEIWTSLRPVAPDATDITVAFEVPVIGPERADAIGRSYVTLYAGLWDEDEGMMRSREEELARLRAPRPRDRPRVLGSLEELRPRLPLRVVWGGRDFRIVELGGELVAHTAVCPHRLGPLGDAPVEDGHVRCPWHGYRFDLRSRRCVELPRLGLPRPPRVEVDAKGRVSLAPA